MHATPEEIWAVLEDPGLVAKMTPFVKSISSDGTHWMWDLDTIPGLGVSLAPSFTVRMDFDEPHRIDFEHDPPEGSSETAGVSGHYVLDEVQDGTHLGIDLTVKVDLPLSKLTSPAVTTAMSGVLAEMGRRFSKNLLEHLGTTADDVPD